MKRKLSILVLVILLGITGYYTVFRNNSTLNPFTTDFALRDPDRITKITISDLHGTISMDKIEGTWKIGERQLSNQKVKDLLFLVSLIEISAPAPVSSADTINYCLQQGARITFYHNKRIANSFSLCKHGLFLYAMQKDSRKAYRISIRGYGNTDLSALVSSELQAWKKNSLIDLGASDIKSVSINYADPKKRGFFLQLDSINRPVLFDLNGQGIEQPIDMEQMKEYLYFFSDIKHYPDESSTLHDDLIKHETPFCKLIISSQKSDTIEIDGYRSNNPNGFYASHPEFGLIFLKYRDFDPILVTLDYFLKN